MMKKAEIFDQNVMEYEAWYKKHPFVFESELQAIRMHFREIPPNSYGIEVGLGTGRFSRALGIKEGVEPSEEMAEKAVSRGIEVIHGFAERLPYRDLHFDFVLFVTICHLDDVKEALREANRVLKHKGTLIIGFLDARGEIAGSYTEKKMESTFYRYARFWSVKELHDLIKSSGFKELSYYQTLFGDLDAIQSVQIPKEGHGEGSFVVVKAVKK